MNKRKYTYTYSPRAGRPNKSVFTRTPRERGRTWLRSERREDGFRPLWLPILIAAVLIGGLTTTLVWVAGPGESPLEPNRGPALAGIEESQERPQAPDIHSSRGSDGGGYSYSGDLEPPPIGALAATVIEAPCGAVLYEANAHMRLPPASLTKIATAVVIAERTEPSEIVQIRVDGNELSAVSGSSVMGLSPGERLTVRDLLYGMLLPSGNDAAIALAQHISGTVPEFVQLMNDKVRELGLTDTHFTNPHGLDDSALYTSAHDIAILGEELLKIPSLAQVVNTTAYQPAWDGPSVENLNLLLGQYPGVLGVKTGYTDQARHTIVAAAERDGRRLIVSALGSENAYGDAIALLDWGFYSAPPSCVGTTEAQVAGAAR